LGTPHNRPYDVERAGDDEWEKITLSPFDSDDDHSFRRHSRLRKQKPLLYWRKEAPLGEKSTRVCNATQLSRYSWQNAQATKHHLQLQHEISTAAAQHSSSSSINSAQQQHQHSSSTVAAQNVYSFIKRSKLCQFSLPPYRLTGYMEPRGF
jgi:hypothetical protein